MNAINLFGTKEPSPQQLDLELKADLHKYVLEQMEDDGLIYDMSTPERHNILLPLTSYIHQYFDTHHINISMPDHEVDHLANQLLDEMVGYGPIEELLRDPSVDDILINGPKHVFVERNGVLEQAEHQFLNDEHVIRVIRRMLSPLGRRIDESNPMVDARLPDGSRINAIIPPLALDGACLSVRKFKQDGLTETTLLAKETLSQEIFSFEFFATRFFVLFGPF